MVKIQEETPEHAEAVQHVNHMAFGTSAEAELVTALWRDSAIALALVAKEEADVVGHILFSPVRLDNPRIVGSAVGLGPMSVLPSWQRRGVGSLLITTALERLRTAGHSVVVVLGHPDYYPRFGFSPAHLFGLRCEYKAPPEAFMVLELVPGVLAGIESLVKYHPAFGSP